MHRQRRYKLLCISSVILRYFESFEKYEGFSVNFPKILDALKGFKKVIDSG